MGRAHLQLHAGTTLRIPPRGIRNATVAARPPLGGRKDVLAQCFTEGLPGPAAERRIGSEFAGAGVPPIRPRVGFLRIQKGFVQRVAGPSMQHKDWPADFQQTLHPRQEGV